MSEKSAGKEEWLLATLEQIPSICFYLKKDKKLNKLLWPNNCNVCLSLLFQMSWAKLVFVNQVVVCKPSVSTLKLSVPLSLRYSSLKTYSTSAIQEDVLTSDAIHIIFPPKTGLNNSFNSSWCVLNVSSDYSTEAKVEKSTLALFFSCRKHLLENSLPEEFRPSSRQYQWNWRTKEE